MKKTIFDLLDRKGTLPVSMLTAYDYNTARAIDEAGIDMILVGDSLGNVNGGRHDPSWKGRLPWG